MSVYRDTLQDSTQRLFGGDSHPGHHAAQRVNSRHTVDSQSTFALVVASLFAAYVRSPGEAPGHGEGVAEMRIAVRTSRSCPSDC